MTIEPINCLPNFITDLTLKAFFFNQSLDCLPNSLINLTLDGRLLNNFINNLPDSIQTIKTFNTDFKKLLSKQYHNIVSFIEKFD